MSEIEFLQDSSEQALAVAIEANFCDLTAYHSRVPEAELRDDAEMVLLLTGIPLAFFNLVMRARLAPETADAAIEATLARFRARRVPMLWYTGPTSEPSDQGARLQAQGLKHVDDAPGMAIDLLALNEPADRLPGLTITPVVELDDLRDYIHVAAISFEMPDHTVNALFDLYTRLGYAPEQLWRHYVGRLGSEPVACSTLFLSAGVAGIYTVGVLPEARRRGIGSAITLAPLRDARALGYRFAILGATPMGFPVYRRLGFQTYCTFGIYMLDAPA